MRQADATHQRSRDPAFALNGGLLAFWTILFVSLALTFPDAYESIHNVVFPPPEIGEGLIHTDIKPRLDERNGEKFLIVEGLVENVTEKTLTVPMLKVVLTNAAGEELQVLTHVLSVKKLHSGETASFQVEFENPPAMARSMTIGFVEPVLKTDGISQD